MDAKFNAVSRIINGWVGDFNDLDERTRMMFYTAREVRNKAQARYSHYWVGTTVQSARTGRTYDGCNVERASWTQTTHAEQNAMDTMIASEGAGARVAKLVFLAGPENVAISLPPVITRERRCWEIGFTEIPSPCGHCLQIIWENCLGDRGVEIYSLLTTGQVTIVTIDNAFPLKFGPIDLGVKY